MAFVEKLNFTMQCTYFCPCLALALHLHELTHKSLTQKEGILIFPTFGDGHKTFHDDGIIAVLALGF